ncbi:MAG TPA: 3-isopropylmalate dehydratase small subunit [Negativicutes bacterium]|jgi:3-isopropylmalate/(R)-2-methylmalate dehydratase small subunit
MILEGKIWRYGDNVDTDVIIPARHLTTAEPKELAVHCMEDIDPKFASTVQPGEIIVAGKNFGCGSSREHAPVAIKACGIVCIIADSFARIFYRNSINIGLPLIELGDAVNKIRPEHTIKIDLAAGTVENTVTGEVYKAQPLPEFIQAIVHAGGLINYVKGVRT